MGQVIWLNDSDEVRARPAQINDPRAESPMSGNESPGTNTPTPEDGWLVIAGIDPEIAGWWRMTATYKGASLSYVYCHGR